MAGRKPALAVRRLAISTLAWTGAAASFLTPAHAITLGELAVESALGQPLNARVPVELAPGETLAAGCVSSPAGVTKDLSTVPEPRFGVPVAGSTGQQELRITTVRPLYEPMYELQLQVRCPGTALLVRQYVLMLDLPGARDRVAAADAKAAAVDPVSVPAAAPAPAVAASANPPRPAISKTADRAPVAAGAKYRVQSGDTLSGIAARVGDRNGLGIWQMADRIFKANPDAFIGANPNLIKLGAEIVIPSAATATQPETMPTVPPVAAAHVSRDTAAQVPVEVLPPAAPVMTPTAAAAPVVPDAPSSTTGLSEPAVSEAVSIATEPPAAVAAAPATSPARTPVPAAGLSASPTDAERDAGAPPWLAALMGVLIGVGASFVLLRERLMDALRRSPPTGATISARSGGAAQPSPAPVRPPPAIKTLPAREPSMVVVEEPADRSEESGARVSPPSARKPVPAAPVSDAVVGPDTQDDLASLFGAEPDINLFETQGTGMSASADEADIDLDLSAAAADTKVDQDIGWIDDGDETALTPTDQAGLLGGSTGDTVEQMDLNTMSEKALDDAQLSETLKEALNLLESDYEDELTASQVIDRKQFGKFLEKDGEEDTLIRTGTDQIPRR